MIKWIRLSSGEYESQDKRFYIIKTYDRIYKDHWKLMDRNEKDKAKSIWHQNTLLECKMAAEEILLEERKISR